MQQRLEFIVNYTKVDIIDLDPETIDLASIEQQVSEHLEILD